MPAGRMCGIRAALIAAVWTTSVAAAPYDPADFVRVQKGELPVILAAPHGGRKPLPGVPERKGIGVEQFATVADDRTSEIVELAAAELEKLTGRKPWVVVARFDRKSADANRPADAAYEHPAARPAYDRYHAALDAACKAVKALHGRGLLLDVHGQGTHPDAIARGTLDGKSVVLLRERFGAAAVGGKRSVLGAMERAGYKVLPKGTADDKEDPRYAGAFTVKNYGSHTGYGIDVVQLEFGNLLRAADRHARTAKDLAAAVREFHDEYLVDSR